MPRLTRRRLSRSRALPAVLLVGALAIPAVTGCEAGLDAPTLAFHPAAAGAGAVSGNGDVTISNAFILGPAIGQQLPAGGQAGVFASISSNNGDQLTGVKANGSAASVKLTGGTVNIPANGVADLTGPTPHIVLVNLSAALTGGQNPVSVTFEFANAGEVTVQLPVESQAYDYATYAQPPAAAPSPSPSSTASLTRSTTHKKAKTSGKSAKAKTKAKATSSASPTPTP